MYLGRTFFNLLIIPIIRDSLFEMLSMRWDQSKVSVMVVPKNQNQNQNGVYSVCRIQVQYKSNMNKGKIN